MHRKVEGEGKGEGHGVGSSQFDGPEVPLRRWEDWERSRLRKLRREERRRREFERAHPAGYVAGDGDLLSARADARSQYDGSDTLSVASSDDDHWGPQIGGYNEHHAQYPPPPAGLLPPAGALAGARTLGGAELEAMLETGFDDAQQRRAQGQPAAAAPGYAPRYQLTDGSTTQLLEGYAPLSRGGSPGEPETPTGVAPGADWPREDGRRKGEYGPLGPLDPSARF